MSSIVKQDGTEIYVGDHLVNLKGTKEVVVSSIDKEDVILRWIGLEKSDVISFTDSFSIPYENFKKSGWRKIQ